jgi:hypothetical protein
VSNPFPRERVLEELRALREATQALHHRLDALIGELDGDAASDPRIVEIARRAIAELRAKQRHRTSSKTGPKTDPGSGPVSGSDPVVRNVHQRSAAASPSARSSEGKSRGPRRQP